ncbi:response regulator [Amycolatopsis sp. NPDC059027]|uniref:response regulator n=1 Tax=Amycolatopsis sp. NPDC059027 TaxID=3346709 RepID=UPI00366FB1E3
MTADDLIGVVVADDQPLVRVALVSLLNAQPDMTVLAEAATGTEAVAATESHRPDVVLMDVRMPEMTGVEATARIMALPDPPAVLTLTTYDIDEYVYGALRAGSMGFLLKDAPPERIVEGVQAVARGEGLLAPSVTRRLIQQFAVTPDDDAEPSACRALARLTERETEVLVQVAQGLSNMEVATALRLSEATVKTHLHRLMAKLGLTSRTQVVIAAYESGLVRPGLHDRFR